ncbi:MAG: SOS response-associated peptidase [Syntrophaceticus sp.]|jgi:putative SOS response-associated peptidase YedK
MCGRFSLTVEGNDLVTYFHIRHGHSNYQSNYNIAPSQRISVITGPYDQRRLSLMRWGLIPSWAKAPAFGYKMFNARTETIDQKPSFRNAFFRRRCLIPADSFYEWRQKGEPPFRIYLPDKPLFVLAGIWELWQPRDDEAVLSCSMITTKPNAFMEEIHNRMPVILGDEESMIAWLEGTKLNDLKELLVPYSGQMAAEPYPLHVKKS